MLARVGETVRRAERDLAADERKAITEALKRRRGELDVVVGPVQPGPRNERQGGNE